MKIGLLGFPRTGKSSLFRILTGAAAETVHADRAQLRAGIARVPDPRLDEIAAKFKPKKVTPATLEFWDPVGFQKPDDKDFLPYQEIRAAEAFVHIIRAFEDPAVPPPEGGVDPKRDIELMESELLMADLSVVEKRLEKLAKQLRKLRNPDDETEQKFLQEIREGLEKGTPVRRARVTPEAGKKLRGFAFLTDKPILGVVNVGEDQAAEGDRYLAELAAKGDTYGLHAGFSHVSAKIELEIAQLEPEDAEAFRKELGIPIPCHLEVIRNTFRILDEISFFTYGEDEVKAWTVPAGTPAPRAAGRIHSDIERGFIRAEVISYTDFMEAGSLAVARDRGTLRTEGKDYLVADGDMIIFRFNV